MKRTRLVHRNAGSLRELNRYFPRTLIVEICFFGSFAFRPSHKFFIITIKLFQQGVIFSKLLINARWWLSILFSEWLINVNIFSILLPVTAIYMTQNPFSFNYTTLLQTSTYQNKKFDIKNAGFMRPAITFLNIQLSNSRDSCLAKWWIKINLFILAIEKKNISTITCSFEMELL